MCIYYLYLQYMISKAAGTGIMTMVRFLLQETHQCDHKVPRVT